MRSATLYTTTFLLCVATTLAAGCRSSRRSVRVSDDAATLKVQLDRAIGAPLSANELVYEFGNCVSPVNGTIEDGNVVSFTAAGLKEGLTDCQLRIRTISAVGGITFAEGSEPNVVYWAKGILIRSSAGVLKADANLQPLFVPTQPGNPNIQAFTLRVPVKFPAPEESKPITAELLCTPRALNGLYPASAPIEGEFTFTIAADEATSFRCQSILVAAGGVARKYAGQISEGVFKTEAGGEASLPSVELKLQTVAEPPKPNTEGVQVETEASSCDKATQVFDVAKGECVPAN